MGLSESDGGGGVQCCSCTDGGFSPLAEVHVLVFSGLKEFLQCECEQQRWEAAEVGVMYGTTRRVCDAVLPLPGIR